MKIHYIIGDALEPVRTPALICHVCNDLGLAGSGFVVPLRKINPKVLEAYERWSHEGMNSEAPFELGATQIVPFKDNIWVSNMIAQHDVRTIHGVPPIRYGALGACLESSYIYAVHNKLTIHMPRIGAVRSGGDWKKIEEIIQGCIDIHLIETYVYTLPNETGQWPNTPYENKDKAPDNTKDIDDLNKIFK